MSTTTTAQKAALLNILRIKIAKIGKAERRYIDRREENARAYAEALADANIITDDERDELYDKAKGAAEAAVRAFKAAEATPASAAPDFYERFISSDPK